MAEIELRIDPLAALAVIAAGGCTSNTSGSCMERGRHPLARFGADVWCHACLACLALGWNPDRKAPRLTAVPHG
jgi:hypothetical protein